MEQALRVSSRPLSRVPRGEGAFGVGLAATVLLGVFSVDLQGTSALLQDQRHGGRRLGASVRPRVAVPGWTRPATSSGFPGRGIHLSVETFSSDVAGQTRGGACGRGDSLR